MRLRFVALLLLAFGLACTGITRESLWRDEVDSIRFAADVWQVAAAGEGLTAAAGHLARYLTQPGWNGPLYFLLLEPWLRAAGVSELALRLPSALAGVMAVALGYALASRLLGRQAGYLAALLTVTNPYLIWYAAEGKMYAPVTALVLLSTCLLLRALAAGNWKRWLAYLLVTTLAFYTHILTPLLLPIHAALVLLLHPGSLRRPAVWLAAGALTLPYLPLLLWQWPLLVQPAVTGFPFIPLPTMARRMGEVFSRGITGMPAALPLALLLGAMALAVVAPRPPLGAPQTRPGRAWLVLALWAFFPLPALYLISLRRPLFTERYLIWTLPAWLALAAAGLAGLARRGRQGRVAALIWTAGLVTAGLAGIGAQWGTPIRPDFRSAAALVAARCRPGELVLFQIPYAQHTFDYYAPGLHYLAAEGPYTNRGATPDEVYGYLGAVTAGRDQAWLILSEVAMWDTRNLTLDWFTAHGELEWFRFNQVDVIRWQRGARPIAARCLDRVAKAEIMVGAAGLL